MNEFQDARSGQTQLKARVSRIVRPAERHAGMRQPFKDLIVVRS